MSNRLEVLKGSLVKKEADFARRLGAHFNDVKSANGQPLNDKRNGNVTLNRWDRQNESLKKLQAGIESTKEAIEREQWKINGVESAKEDFPAPILALIKQGKLVQWRKYPNILFVEGVDKARIIWNAKKKTLSHKFATSVANQEQYTIFRETYNKLFNEIKS